MLLPLPLQPSLPSLLLQPLFLALDVAVVVRVDVALVAVALVAVALVAVALVAVAALVAALVAFFR